ncbi:534_t:CDS:2, partial [Dentiscutata erythropus]
MRKATKMRKEESLDSLASASALSATSTSISSLANTSKSNTSNRINSGGCILAPARDEWLKLEAHFALQCPYVEDHIQQSYLLRVASHNNEEESPENLTKSKKPRLDKQNNLSRFFLLKSKDLSEERINSINILLLKAFIVCGISFSIVENPFFIDLLQNLCSSYQPLLREVLAGCLLDQEYVKVIVKHETIFRESKNLTL